MTTPRGEILEQARNLTEGDRNKAYGSPFPNMQCFTVLVSEYLNGRIDATQSNPKEVKISAVDGAIIMCLAKISRIAANPTHMDSFTDLAAYAAIAGECAQVLAEGK